MATAPFVIFDFNNDVSALKAAIKHLKHTIEEIVIAESMHQMSTRSRDRTPQQLYATTRAELHAAFCRLDEFRATNLPGIMARQRAAAAAANAAQIVTLPARNHGDLIAHLGTIMTSQPATMAEVKMGAEWVLGEVEYLLTCHQLRMVM
ncbi:MAG: hypothetical protein Q9183_005505 [Haloplaca sp. 2 TL-2023]